MGKTAALVYAVQEFLTLLSLYPLQYSLPEKVQENKITESNYV